MYVHIKPTTKQRILAFFMTFAIIFVSLPYVGITAQAYPTAGNGIITSIPSYSKYLGQADNPDDGDYKYTGMIKPVKASVYDYLTDAEINGTYNSLNDNAYTYYNRYNPYNTFDTAVSNMPSPGTSTVPHDETITIIYKSRPFNNSEEVCVHLWDSSDPSNKTTTWPGISMTHINTEGNVYVYKATIWPEDLGFTPDRFIFNNNNNGAQTDTVSYTVMCGREYTFSKGAGDNITVIYAPDGSSASDTDNYNVYYWNSRGNSGWPGPNMDYIGNKKWSYSFNTPQFGIPNQLIFSKPGNSQTKDLTPPSMEVGYTFLYTAVYDRFDIFPTNISVEDTGTSQDLVTPNSKLYLGNFLARISNDPINNPHTDSSTNGKDNNNPSDYNATGVSKGHMSPSSSGGNLDSSTYSNFNWQANIAQRPVNSESNRTSAAVQGLVDSTLTGGKITQGGVNLPYFDSSWSGVSNNYMKCWESTDASPISFPFYEVLKTASASTGYTAGTNASNGTYTEQAKYYEFNSADANLVFDYNQRRFEETNVPIHAAGDGKIGYFPFNTVSDTNSGGSKGKTNNYGFGTKFEMTFKLNEDGMIPAVTNEGKTIRSEDGPSKVDTLFEFEGDDDLWVFIDDKLVLDMGGSHAASSGRINFKNRQAVVDNAVRYGAGGVDNVGVKGTIKTIDITDKINGGYKVVSTETNDPADHVQNDLTKPLRNGYDPEEIHTMTIFYMERGMSESNLLIRFNFPVEPNYNKMKVKEQTDFSDVNDGLKNLTMKAADTDVFRYKIENKGTKNDDVLKINSIYPTKENYIRTVQGITTKLTSSSTDSPTQQSYYFTPGATASTNYLPVSGISYNWVDEYASNGTNTMSSNMNVAGRTTTSSDTDGGGYMYLMYGKPSGAGSSEVKSSGEFEGQFARYSLMKITQDDDLYTPSSHATDGGAASLSTARYSTPRTISGYYDVKNRFIFSTVSSTYEITNGQEFNFRNNIELVDNSTATGDLTTGGTTGHKDSNEKTSIQMTAQFVNAPKTGAITITKAQPSGDASVNDEFTIKIRFEDVFGVTGVNADTAADYSGIVYKRYSSVSGRNLDSGSDKLTAGKVTVGGVSKDCGTFKLKVGETAYIENIPVGTKYYIYEEEPKYKPDPISSSGTVEAGRFNTTSHKTEKLISTDPDTYDVASSNNNVTVTNYSNSLTIKEVTDFSGVNSGLLGCTKKAAENDVFKYTVKNNSTVNGANSWIPVATYDTYQRQANGASSPVVFSGRPLQYEEIDDVDHVYLDVSRDISGEHWYDSTPVFVAWLYNADPEEGVPVEFSYVSENLYKVDPGDYQNIAILRVYKYQIQTDWGNEWINHIWEKRKNNNSKVYLWGRIDPRPLTKGYTYIPTNFNNVGTDLSKTNYKYGFTYIATPHKIQTSNIIYDYSYNNFIYDSSDSNHYVKNVNYEWVDEFAVKTSGTANDLLAGTTDNTGSFYLMHGETNATNGGSGDHESSATFYNQFAIGSTMTVEQGSTLTSPNGGNPDTLQGNNRGANNTSLGTYYTTTSKTLTGSITSSPLANGVNSFAYDNGNSTNQSVRITETFRNTVNVGSITISKEVSGDESNSDPFQFRIILKDVFGVTGNNVENNGYGEITITNAFNANGTTAGKLAADGTFYVKQGIDAVISGIPVETTYQIVETTKSGWSARYKIGDSGSFNSGASTPASGNKISSNGITVSFINTPPAPSTNEIILTKTAKEQVGTKAVGAELTGAAFKLVKIESPNNNDGLRFNYDSTDTTTNKYTYAATGGTYNQSGNWLTTGSDGKLHIKGLPVGDYYLEEQTAPAGYSEKDSNDVVNNVVQNKKVYFSIGDNTTTKYLTCSDEMAPAYIKLYEHINEKLPAWGNPTFIFKITQTGYYKNDGTSDIETISNGKTMIVALTVDDDGKFTTDTVLGSDYDGWYQESTDELEGESPNQTREYQGMYHIDSEGKIRLEPGTYSITRVPVSRYEFVADTWKLEDDTTANIYTTNKHTETNQTMTGSEPAIQNVTIPQGKTALVHYYDKVAYYDKFSHVDEEINKFYTLDASKNNTTAKGIRVEFNGKADTSGTATIDTAQANSTSANTFNAWFINVDGTEREMTATEKANLVISDPTSQFESGNFNFIDSSKQIQISNTSNYVNKVFTLKAVYKKDTTDLFETTFDLVFARS